MPLPAMMMRTTITVLVSLSLVNAGDAPKRSAADIIKASSADEWQALSPQNTLIMDINGQQVILELAERFAPAHAANIRTLAHEGYYNNTAVIRVQDNYVTQWGDPNDDDKEEDKGKMKSLGSAHEKLPAEFSIPARGLKYSAVPDADGWAPKTGFVDGMPVALSPKANQAWIPHCYGAIGAARGNEVDSSNGTGLYVIIGQPARRLDLNITVVGRVLKGMEALSGLPRGTGNLGFYEKPEQFVPIPRIRLLADVPEAERPKLEVMKTDSRSFKAIIEAARHTSNSWFVHSPEYTSVCNINVPVRSIDEAKKG